MRIFSTTRANNSGGKPIRALIREYRSMTLIRGAYSLLGPATWRTRARFLLVSQMAVGLPPGPDHDLDPKGASSTRSTSLMASRANLLMW